MGKGKGKGKGNSEELGAFTDQSLQSPFKRTVVGAVSPEEINQLISLCERMGDTATAERYRAKLLPPQPAAQARAQQRANEASRMLKQLDTKMQKLVDQ